LGLNLSGQQDRFTLPPPFTTLSAERLQTVVAIRQSSNPVGNVIRFPLQRIVCTANSIFSMRVKFRLKQLFLFLLILHLPLYSWKRSYRRGRCRHLKSSLQKQRQASPHGNFPLAT